MALSAGAAAALACVGLASLLSGARGVSVVLGARRASATRRAIAALQEAPFDVDLKVIFEREEVRRAVEETAKLSLSSRDTDGIAVIASDDADWTLQAVAMWPFRAAEAPEDACALSLPDRERFGSTISSKYAGGLLVLRPIDLNNTTWQDVERECARRGERVVAVDDDFESAERYRATTSRIRRRRRRRLGGGGGGGGDAGKYGPLRDASYHQPLSDVSDATSATLAMAVGYEAGAPRSQPAVGLNSRGSVTRAQALCVLGDLNLGFVGDSVTRFHYYVLNEFLQTGDVSRIDGTWGEPPVHYDTYDRWTHASDSSKHEQHFVKTIDVDEPFLCPDKKQIVLQFWFLADWASIGADAVSLLAEVVSPWADVVVYNAGFWEIKENPGRDACDPYDASGLRAAYRHALTSAFRELESARTVYFRTSSCCGEDSLEAPEVIGDAEATNQAALGIWGLNQDALSVIDNFSSVRTLDVWPLIVPRALRDRTFDGLHPAAPVYHIWNMMLLWTVAEDERIYPKDTNGRRASDAYFFSGGALAFATPAPSAPSPLPTGSPTVARCVNGVRDFDETDVDCGGATCFSRCGMGKACAAPSDCVDAGFCSELLMVCVPAPTATPTTLLYDGSPWHPDDDDDDDEGYGKKSGHAIRGAEGSTTANLDSSRVRPGYRFGGLASSRAFCEASAGLRLALLVAVLVLAARLRALCLQLVSALGRARVAAAATKETTSTSAAGGTAAAGAEICGWLLVAAFCNSRAPAGLLPAGTRILSENPDLWCTVMAALLLGSACVVRELPPKESSFLNRAQTNEWKGWMQVAFVAYHLANAQDVYVPIRWFVSAYVWMTGFGNARYFSKTRDLSLARFAKMLWRMNFFAAPLSLATGTPWIQYYVVALHTVHFALVFLAYAIVAAFSTLFSKKNQHVSSSSSSSSPREGWGALVVLAIVVFVVWELPGTYDATLGPALTAAFGPSFEQNFWYRTRMDYLSSLSGAACAAAFPFVVAAWESSSRPPLNAALLAFGACACAALAGWVAATRGANHERYRAVQPYVATLWVPAYVLARNATPNLRGRVSVPLEWIGARSLELYLLQFHLLMNRGATHVLWLLPDENWPGVNLGLCVVLWLLAADRVFRDTAELRDRARDAPYVAATCLAAAAVAYATLSLLSCSADWAISSLAVAALVGAAAVPEIFAARGSARTTCARSSIQPRHYAALRTVSGPDEEEDDEEDDEEEEDPARRGDEEKKEHRQSDAPPRKKFVRPKKRPDHGTASPVSAKSPLRNPDDDVLQSLVEPMSPGPTTEVPNRNHHQV